MYAFEYQRPKTLADAAKALASSGGKPLAGGQSLVAAMKLRLAQPGTLVDLCDMHSPPRDLVGCQSSQHSTTVCGRHSRP